MLSFMAPLAPLSRQSHSASRTVAAAARAFSSVQTHEEPKYRPFSVESRDVEGSNASRNLRRGKTRPISSDDGYWSPGWVRIQ